MKKKVDDFCGRMNIFNRYYPCIPDKLGCITCICTDCNKNRGFCTAKRKRTQEIGEYSVIICSFYNSINPLCEPEDYNDYKAGLKQMEKNGNDGLESVYTPFL